MYKFYIVKPLKEDLFEGLGIEGKLPSPKKLEYFSVLTSEELKGKKVFLILKNPQFFYELYGLNLPVYSDEILKLRLTDRVNTTGYLTGPYYLYWKILKKEGNFYELSYLALENRELLRLKNLLKGVTKSKLEGISFLPFALARVFKDVKEESLLIHREKEGLWILIFKEGLPLYIEFFQVDELLGINFDELTGRLNFLKNLFYRDHSKELTRIYLFSEDLKEGLENSGFEVILQEIQFPEFLYAPLVEASFNLLPEEERAVKEVMEGNYKISYAFIGLALIFLLFSFFLKKVNSELEKEMSKKEALITESINRFLSEYPEDKIRNFRTYLEERERLIRNPSPERLLYNIVKACEGFKINSFEIKEGNNTYHISLSGEKSAYPQEANILTQELLKKLGSFMEIQQNQFDYFQEKNIIIFKISGKLKP